MVRVRKESSDEVKGRGYEGSLGERELLPIWDRLEGEGIEKMRRERRKVGETASERKRESGQGRRKWRVRE